MTKYIIENSGTLVTAAIFINLVAEIIVPKIGDFIDRRLFYILLIWALSLYVRVETLNGD
jgi:hypothetical protein